MKYTNQYSEKVVHELNTVYSIKARIVEGVDGLIGLDRTSCHNSPYFRNDDEWDIIKQIPQLIKDIIGEDVRVMIGSKTDDEWFVEIYSKE